MTKTIKWFEEVMGWYSSKKKRHHLVNRYLLYCSFLFLRNLRIIFLFTDIFWSKLAA
ncbi:hypothetical protein [Acetatifactor muris]|uniref:hypothetical protein n=1 Tax=Acetatifactor muris TaxID=879566 RepID=UPI003A7F2549